MNLNKQISRHFKLIEFVLSNTALKLDIDNTPDDFFVQNIIYLVQQVLEPARQALGRCIVITSGYRCPELNKAVGGALNSGHLQGFAADLRLFDVDYTNKLTAILSRNECVTELLLEHSGSSSWLHVNADPSISPRRINLNYRA